MTREELCEVLKQSEEIESLLADLIAAKQAYDHCVADILRRTFDDD